jgi:hypothetical protein
VNALLFPEKLFRKTEFGKISLERISLPWKYNIINNALERKNVTLHESSVNYQNLIKDLAEMYPLDVSEVVLVEIIANSLDAKPDRIEISFDPLKKILVVTDNGKGMNFSEFEQYHDFAAGLKTRGSGIGFAGVGAKISFNIASKVLTETRSPFFEGGSNWYFDHRNKLVWEDIHPIHLSGFGTRVEVRFSPTEKISYSSTEDIEKLLNRHYLPLLDSHFLDYYEKCGFYSNTLKFVINGKPINPGKLIEKFHLESVREFKLKKAGREIGLGFFGLSPSDYPIGPDVCGVLLCTHGKVIKADFFNQFPNQIATRILGIVEIPELINFLITSKTDFSRQSRHKEFESIYDPARQEFKAWLDSLGILPQEVTGSDEALKLERELKKILNEVPELSEFFGFRQKKHILQENEKGTLFAIFQEGAEGTFPTFDGDSSKNPGLLDVGNFPGVALSEKKEGDKKASQISRNSKRGPKISFLEAVERVDLAWVDGNNIVINSGHPSYIKVRSNTTARRVHCLFAIAAAIQRFLSGADSKSELGFVDKMMAAWGKK